MPKLCQRCVKTKLTRLTMLTSGVALLVSVTLFGLSDAKRFRSGMERDLQTLADVVGASAASALDFDDEAAAAKTLAALEHKPVILRAAIYNKDNKVLASYARPGEPAAGGPPFGAGTARDSSTASLKFSGPSSAARTGWARSSFWWICRNCGS